MKTMKPNVAAETEYAKFKAARLMNSQELLEAQ
jgi:hypothetical protein